MTAAVLCGAAGAAPAAAATSPEAFYSFSDLVRLTSSMHGTPAVDGTPEGGAIDATAAVVVEDMESASAGASRAADDGALHLGKGARGQALRVDAPGARVLQASAEREARYEFSVTAQPQGWLLLLSGLAAAGWVARRRLRYPIHG
jgi:hypothetical protein